MNDFKSLLQDAAARDSYKPTLALLTSVWPNAVGPEIARQSRPVQWDGDELILEVSPTWAKELRKSSGQILRRLNLLLPWKIAILTFVDGPPAPTESKVALSPAPPLGENDLETISTLPPGLQILAEKITQHVKGEK